MKFVSDPSIPVKIQKMKQRVRWQDTAITKRNIDQTRLVLANGDDTPEFSFMVVGDSGSGAHRGHNPQRQIAEQMLSHKDGCRFVLHTGDVIYLVGSSEYYPGNFIEPYREFLVGGESHDRICYDRMVFNLPFLLVPGNHDYYDLPFAYGALVQLALPLRYLFKSMIDLDVGWHGSGQGNAYARAFLDYLTVLNGQDLAQHLDRHYSAESDTGRCLHYQPSSFTRLPNRYYTFRCGGIDFFALDSNTFNAPLPLGPDEAGTLRRLQLEQQRTEIVQQKQSILQQAARLNLDNPEESEHMDDLRTRLEQLEESEQDIDKQLKVGKRVPPTDQEQLDWLQQRLIQSWKTESVRGRVIYFHHPPYVTEATKWDQAQTLAIRYRLRRVLDAVAAEVGQPTPDRPLVDLVLNGHAHCLEYLRTEDTGHADSYMNWIVCGGSGYSLRRQRREGAEITEAFINAENIGTRTIARSHLFIGRNGHGLAKRRPYSFLRIDVKEGRPPKFVVRPFIAEWYKRGWVEQELDPFVL